MEGRVKEFTVCFLAVDWSLGNNDRKTSGLVRYTVHSAYICTQGLNRWSQAQWRLCRPLASQSARSYVDMAAICERFTPCHCLLLLPLLDRCELWAFFTTCIHFRSLDMWVSIWDCHNLFLLHLIDWWVSVWELSAFHILSLFTPSLSIWLVSVYIWEL